MILPWAGPMPSWADEIKKWAPGNAAAFSAASFPHQYLSDSLGTIRLKTQKGKEKRLERSLVRVIGFCVTGFWEL